MATVHYCYAQHVMLLPIYGVPCLLAAWKMNRRWGTVFAYVAAMLGPLVARAKDPVHIRDIMCWNMLMRFIPLQMCVFLADRTHWQKNFFGHRVASRRRPADFGANWAVVLFSGLWFLLIAWGDIYRPARLLSTAVSFSRHPGHALFES